MGKAQSASQLATAIGAMDRAFRSEGNTGEVSQSLQYRVSENRAKSLAEKYKSDVGEYLSGVGRLVTSNPVMMNNPTGVTKTIVEEKSKYKSEFDKREDVIQLRGMGFGHIFDSVDTDSDFKVTAESSQHFDDGSNQGTLKTTYKIGKNHQFEHYKDISRNLSGGIAQTDTYSTVKNVFGEVTDALILGGEEKKLTDIEKSLTSLDTISQGIQKLKASGNLTNTVKNKYRQDYSNEVQKNLSTLSSNFRTSITVPLTEMHSRLKDIVKFDPETGKSVPINKYDEETQQELFSAQQMLLDYKAQMSRNTDTFVYGVEEIKAGLSDVFASTSPMFKGVDRLNTNLPDFIKEQIDVLQTKLTGIREGTVQKLEFESLSMQADIEGAKRDINEAIVGNQDALITQNLPKDIRVLDQMGSNAITAMLNWSVLGPLLPELGSEVSKGLGIVKDAAFYTESDRVLKSFQANIGGSPQVHKLDLNNMINLESDIVKTVESIVPESMEKLTPDQRAYATNNATHILISLEDYKPLFQKLMNTEGHDSQRVSQVFLNHIAKLDAFVANSLGYSWTSEDYLELKKELKYRKTLTVRTMLGTEETFAEDLNQYLPGR